MPVPETEPEPSDGGGTGPSDGGGTGPSDGGITGPSDGGGEIEAEGGGEDEDDNDLTLQGSATDDGLRDEEDVWQDLAQDFFKVEENVDEGNSYEEDQRT